jgi:hypothetical protein
MPDEDTRLALPIRQYRQMASMPTMLSTAAANAIGGGAR